MIGNYRQDWAQLQGQRNPALVTYAREIWLVDNSYTGRSDLPAIQRFDLFVKVKVWPVPGIDLDAKRVGVVYRIPGVVTDLTVTGSYFTTLPDGYEEWHVRIHLPDGSPGPLTVNAWYQPMAGNTFFDDLNGELHPALGPDLEGSMYVNQVAEATDIRVTSTGVRGRITARLADLSFVKDVGMVATTDDWATVRSFGMGGSGSPNRWHWVRDLDADFEWWAIDVDIPGDVKRFQYAIVYRHGTQAGVRPYEIWANRRGANYVVERA
jgi:hypothetical protein